MNKAEIARQFTKQTVEQERDLEQQKQKDQQLIIQKLESLIQKSGTIMQQQRAFSEYLQYHSGLIIQTKQEISDLTKELKATKKAQKRIQLIWIITFLTVAIPLSAFWMGWLVYWIFR